MIVSRPSYARSTRPEHPGTVAELADEAALSRSAFFARFSRIVGLPPMEYLLGWRMALAKRLLCDRELGMDQVAERVGSASTFSVAFGRHTGVSPARYGRVHKRQGRLRDGRRRNKHGRCRQMQQTHDIPFRGWSAHHLSALEVGREEKQRPSFVGQPVAIAADDVPRERFRHVGDLKA